MAKQTLTYNTTTGNWELTETNQGKTYTNTLLTDNKNISGDIKINITTKTGTAGTPVAEKGTVSGNKVTITPKVTNTEGYIATGTITGTAIEVTAAELVAGTKTISTSGVQDCKTYASVNVPAGSAKVNNSTIVPAISQSGNKITVNGSTTSSGTVTTTGWIENITSGVASIKTTTYTIPSGILNNEATSGITYTENTDPATVLPKNGALYINAGYYENTKITLGHLIPDPTAPYEDPGSGDMRSGFVAFDSEGNEIIGTMAEVTPTFSGGVASLTGKTSSMTTTMATVNSSTYYVNVQGKAKATRTSVTYANNYTGYLDKASGTNASSSNTSSEDTVVNATVYIQEASVSATLSYDNSTVLTFTPSSPTIANNTTAISGKTRLTATLTTNTASVTTDYYIAVRGSVSAGTTYTVNGGTITGNMNITQEGYATSALNATPTLIAQIKGRNASRSGSTYYLQIPGASVTTASSNNGGANTGITVTPGAATVYVNMSAGYIAKSFVSVEAVTIYDGSYSVIS